MGFEVTGFVPIAGVKHRIRDLYRLGMTYNQIGLLSEVGGRTVRSILASKAYWINEHVADAIYRIPIPATQPTDEWKQGAACRGSSIHIWFPEDQIGRPAHKHRTQTEEARQICAVCDVTPECLDYAIRHDAVGIWAGTTETERTTMRGTNEPERNPEP